MRLRSRGLGRKELVLDFREYAVVSHEDEVVVVGTIRDPVNWDFTIRICQDDVPGMLRLATRPATLGLLLRALFHRRRRHHWSEDPAEHRRAGRERLAQTLEKAPERARLSRAAPAPRRSPAPAGLRAGAASPVSRPSAGVAAGDEKPTPRGGTERSGGSLPR